MLAEVHTGFGVGSAKGFPFIIEYALDVFEELRQAAEEAFQKIPYGGVEIGAVLLGEYEERLVRIREWRPIECDHVNGPSFVLSQADLKKLETQLEELREAPELRGLAPVGWFHTRTRTRLALTPRALEAFNRYFPGPQQITMVMRPSKGGPTMAGFFYREVDGSVHTDFSYHEFPAWPDPEALNMPQRPTAAAVAGTANLTSPFRRTSKAPERVSALCSEEAPMDVRMALFQAMQTAPEETNSGEVSTPMPQLRRDSEERTPFYRRRQVLVSAATVMLASAGLGYQFNRPPSPPPSLALHAERGAGDEILLCWDAEGGWVRQARSGRIRISDGLLRREVNLDGSDLRSGSLAYVRHSSDVEFTLTVNDAKKGQITEHARFIGSPLASPPAPQPTGTPKQVRDQLRREVERTRKTLESETERTQQLEETVRAKEEQLP